MGGVIEGASCLSSTHSPAVEVGSAGDEGGPGTVRVAFAGKTGKILPTSSAMMMMMMMMTS